LCLIVDVEGPKATGNILAFTDTAIRTDLADHFSDASSKEEIQLLHGPDTTITQRAEESGGSGTQSHNMGKESNLKALASPKGIAQ
jgi:hypothetical protein